MKPDKLIKHCTRAEDALADAKKCAAAGNGKDTMAALRKASSILTYIECYVAADVAELTGQPATPRVFQ